MVHNPQDVHRHKCSTERIGFHYLPICCDNVAKDALGVTVKPDKLMFDEVKNLPLQDAEHFIAQMMFIQVLW